MRTAWLLALALAACGDDGAPTPASDAPSSDAPPADADTRDLADRLESQGFGVIEVTCNYDPGARCFRLTIEQPVDHQNPTGDRFAQSVVLLHRDLDSPMVALTSGYWDFYGDYPFELTQLLGANQISIEHRFFASSRPSAQAADWSKLTIAQMASDQHVIISRLRTIYGKPWVTTGASKGGMTASYHRRFYPDDVTATVPYVAPLSLAAGDVRYNTFLDNVGPAACRQALRDIVVEMLQSTRYEALVSRAQAKANQTGATFNRVALRPAVESAILSTEFAFWQYSGVSRCSSVPATTATDNTLWSFLDAVSGVTADGDLDLFDAYYYQASFELGYPDSGEADYTQGMTRYGGDAYAGAYPQGVAVPAYRAEAMQDIDSWVRAEGQRFLFVYGEHDPWTAGQYTLGNAVDSQLSITPQGTHGAGLVDLEPADKAAAFAKLEAWTGVAPDESRVRLRPLPALATPRIPPPLLRALQLRP